MMGVLPSITFEGAPEPMMSTWLESSDGGDIGGEMGYQEDQFSRIGVLKPRRQCSTLCRKNED
jgi:hypothetical protein